ncbi:hypothetical protein NLG97_g8406 [Lecanicillium saksenae]|uniref:Uncharacterized protein n=1 Tax=Lecanicillium saksenae TaxID=468837 RepID=A0ACC1QKM1_9HYPO|nr:hypothetical protein NLG97_g8406 [Lecanicillium saksenae]
MSGSFPDVEEVLAAVKTAKEEMEKGDDDDDDDNGEEEKGEDEVVEKEEKQHAVLEIRSRNSDDGHVSDTSYQEIRHSDAGSQPGDSPGKQNPDRDEETCAEKEEESDRKEGEEEEEEEEEDDGINSFGYFMWCVWPLRRVASTANRYLGLVPRTAQEGDQIWLFSGGRTPYILRPTGRPGRYIFIGEAYVHGIMDGEAAQGKEDMFIPVRLV